MIKCKKPKHLWNEPCTPDMECYINSYEHYNCFCVYMNSIHNEEHTLYQIAHKMDISHTTVKILIDNAISKLKEAAQNGEIDRRVFEYLFKNR